MLHMFQLGIYIYVLEGLFGEKKASVVAKKKRKRAAKQREKEEQEQEFERSDESDSASVITQGKNLLWKCQQEMSLVLHNVTSLIIVPENVDNYSQDNLIEIYHAKWRNWWQWNGDEMQGDVLNVLFIFLSLEHDKFVHLFGGDEFGIDRVKHLLLEWLVIIKEFLKQKSFYKKDIVVFQNWLPEFLAFLSNVVNWQHSAKTKLRKFHFMTHIPSDILKWGIPSAYNSATGESNHKMLKQRSKKTQRQVNLMEEQTGVRYVENLAMSWTRQDLVSTGFVHWIVLTRNLEDKDTQTKFSGHSYYLNSQGIYDITTSGSAKKLSEWHP
jgi:hypothetical protein